MSFSAEMKDFLNAYKTGQSINASRTDQDYKAAQTDALTKKTANENDPEHLVNEAKLEQLKVKQASDSLLNGPSARAAQAQAIAASKANMGLINARRGLVDAQTALYSQPAPGTGLLPNGMGGAAPAAPATGGIPLAPVRMNDDGTLGGVPAYADGGLVEDDEDDPNAPESDITQPALPQQQGVLPTEVAPTVPAAPALTDVSAQRRTYPQKGINGIISPQLAADAAREGMVWGINKAGLNQPGVLKTPAQMLKARQIAQGMGGLSEEEMAAARKAVNPNGELSESQANVAALGSVYQFWANKGEPEKAQRVAFQMLQYYRNATQRYAAIAAKAAEGGNMDLATKAALKAYANVPDGRDMEISVNPDGGLMYSYTDANGDVIAKGVATPQQLVSSAMGLVSGGFDKALLSAAGATPAPPAKATGKPQTAADRTKEGELSNAAVQPLKDAWKGGPVDDEFWAQVGDASQHLLQQNPHMTGHEAATAALSLLAPGKKDPEKADFKITPGEDGEPNTIKFDNGRIIKLDSDQLLPLINTRTARVNAAVKKINDDMEASQQPGWTGKLADAAGRAGKYIADDAGKTMDQIKGAIPEEMIARGGSAIEAGKRALTDALEVLTDPSINVGSLSTDYKNTVRSAAQAVLDKLKSLPEPKTLPNAPKKAAAVDADS